MSLLLILQLFFSQLRMLIAPNQTLDSSVPFCLPFSAAIACTENLVFAEKNITAVHVGLSHKFLVYSLALYVGSCLDQDPRVHFLELRNVMYLKLWLDTEFEGTLQHELLLRLLAHIFAEFGDKKKQGRH